MLDKLDRYKSKLSDVVERFERDKIDQTKNTTH